MYLITSYEDAEKYIGRKADKTHKIYNGMLKTYFSISSWVPDRQNAVRRTETLIKKRIKMQLKSRFHVCGNGFVWEYYSRSFLQAAVRCKMGKCLFLQKVRLPRSMTRPKKKQREDAEDK